MRALPPTKGVGKDQTTSAKSLGWSGEPSGGCGGWSEARGERFPLTPLLLGVGEPQPGIMPWPSGGALVLRENKRRTLSPHHNEAEVHLQPHNGAKSKG
jgi:hypothetical protein